MRNWLIKLLGGFTKAEMLQVATDAANMGYGLAQQESAMMQARDVCLN